MKDKNNKKSKRLQFLGEIWRIKILTILLEKKNEKWSNWNFQIIFYIVDLFYNISLRIENLLSKQISKTKSTYPFDIFPKRVLKKEIKLDDF